MNRLFALLGFGLLTVSAAAAEAPADFPGKIGLERL